MADNKDDILAQFAEFLEAKNESEAEAASADDEIEVWNADGSGMRGKRSSLGAWLEKQGFTLKEVVPDPEKKEEGAKTKTGKTSAPQAGGASVARKYFAQKAAPK